jgi:hypothetical protein
MKKILLYISFLLCALHSFSQAPQNRSSAFVTAVDARLRASLNFGMPITQDTTLNGGLDSLGSLIYAKLYRAVFVRDTNTVGGGHLWTNLSFGGTGIKNLNGLTGATQTFAIGTAGTNFNIVSTGTTHTFNIPIASGTNTGLLSNTSFTFFTNKVNYTDTTAILAGYAQNIVLNLPTNTFSSPNVFTGSHIKTGTVTFNTQSNNTFLAGPASGGVGAVSWRLMVNGDLPVSSVTPGTYTNSTVTVNQQGIVTNIVNGTAIGGQFYDSVTQVNDSTFTLDRPNGTHDTVQIKITVSPAISTLNNGLTLTGTNGQLGGTLLHNTNLFGAGFYTAFVGGRVELSQGVAVASAGNFTVGNDGNLFSVTGNTQINAITNTNWNAGSEIGLIFTGTPTLKNNTAGGAGTSPMLLAGSTDYTAAAGDYIGLRFDGFFWHETSRKLTGAGGVYTFSNGITEFPATRVKLGGTFTQNTTFAGNGFYLAMSGGRFELGSGVAIASANNLVTGSDGNQFSVTGSTQINAITTTNWQSGSHLELIFTGTPTLKNNTAGGVNTAPMLLAGSIDYTAAAGDLIGFSFDGTVWHETNRKLAGSVTAITLNNGLTLTGTLGQLGGTLIQTTTINAGAGFQLAVNGAARSSSSAILAVNLSGASSVTTTTGASFINTATGSASINTALSGTASGASFSNTGLKGTATGTGAIGVSGQGDQDGVSGTGNIGVLGIPTAGSGQAGVKGDGSANTVAGVWGVGNPGVFGQGGGFGGNIGVYGQSLGIAVEAETNDPGTNNISTAIQVVRSGTGSPTSGYGASIDYFMSLNGSPSSALSNQIISKWTDATAATRTSQLVINGTTSAVNGAIADMSGTIANFYGTSVGVRAISGSTGGVFQGTTAGASAASTVTPLAATNITTGSTSSSVTGINVSRQANFTGAAGEGVSIDFGLVDNGNAIAPSGNIINKYTNATAGTSTTEFDFVILNGGVTQTKFSVGGLSTFMTATRFEFAKGGDVASANNLTLGTDGNVFHITGTTQINAITTANWQAGSEIILIFNASLTVKNNTAGGGGTAVIKLAGAADFSATADDVLTLIWDGTSFFEKCRSVN